MSCSSLSYQLRNILIYMTNYFVIILFCPYVLVPLSLINEVFLNWIASVWMKDSIPSSAGAEGRVIYHFSRQSGDERVGALARPGSSHSSQIYSNSHAPSYLHTVKKENNHQFLPAGNCLSICSFYFSTCTLHPWIYSPISAQGSVPMKVSTLDCYENCWNYPSSGLIYYVMFTQGRPRYRSCVAHVC